MKFVWRKLIQSLIKRLVVLLIAVTQGPEGAAALANLGIQIDPIAFEAGLYASIETLRAWVTHQPWTPETLRKIL